MTSAAADNAAHYLYTFPTEVATGEDGALALRWPKNIKPFDLVPGPEQNGGLTVVQARPDALTPKECDRVVALGESAPSQTAGVERGPVEYRVSRIAWLVPGPETQWLYHRLAVLFAEANRTYRLDIRGFVDAVQYTLYGAGEHFEWHLDLGPGSTSSRKISLSIQLSDDDEYAGGQLEFVSREVGPEARQRGTAVIFPSYLGHRVSPVTSGVRRSLVAWAYGPAFR
jgi:PKHD-type hydroxylase